MINTSNEKDSLFEEASKIILNFDKVSASFIQRKLQIGYARAARIIDQLEEEGFLAPGENSEPRKVLTRNIEAKIKQKEEILESPAEYTLPSANILTSATKNGFDHSLKETISDKKQRSLTENIPVPFGFDEKGKLIIQSLDTLGHLVISGNPLSSKMVFVDTLLTFLLFKKTPKELKIIIADPTHYLDFYKGVPHLLTPIMSESDKTFAALKWVQKEIERRQSECAKAGTRSIEKYNEISGFQAFPRILIIINRLSSFLHYSKTEFTYLIEEITSCGKDMGIHLILISDKSSENGIPNKFLFEANKSEALLKTLDNPQAQKLKTIYTSEDNVKEVVKYLTQTIIL